VEHQHRAGSRKGRSDYGEGPIGSLFPQAIGAIMGHVTAVLWDEWAEMSITHRDVHDADVAAVLHLLQQEAEIEQLRRQGRL
jgi:hypothetical protein